MGYAGLVSYGHVAVFAVGCYGAAIATTRFQLGFLTSLCSATALATVFGMVLGLILVRVTYFYFSMLTMALGQLIFLVANRWYDVTSGDAGIQGISRGEFFASKGSYYYLVLFISCTVLFLLYRLLNSPIGYSLQALRENRKAVSFLGMNVFSIQYLALVISSSIGGLAGALYAFLSNSIDPSVASMYLSFEPLLSCILGGVHVFLGPVIGTVMFKSFEAVLVNLAPAFWPFFVGAMLIFFTIALPWGVIGFLQDPRFVRWLWVPTMKVFVRYHDAWFYFYRNRTRFRRQRK
jgi:branched-chain amino acid transport system permease protein